MLAEAGKPRGPAKPEDVMSDLFDAAAMYDEDYLHFFAAPPGSVEFAAHGPVLPGHGSSGTTVADLVWRLLDLRPGMTVLVLGCGPGDLANRLAGPGRQGTRPGSA